jgi:tetratricopeptide (TPR) repeat protein
MLLQDARRREGATESVREAYVNLYGGFILDVPPWLEVVEQRLTDLLGEKSRAQTAEARLSLLQDALERAQGGAPELLATLRLELATAWQTHPRTDYAQAMESSIRYDNEALCVYSVTRYPYQYAKIKNDLGLAYWNRTAGERRENLEQAIACYHEALHVWTLTDFPLEYTKVQNNLGLAYGDRIAGKRWENLERAIACYHEALHVWTLTDFPFEYTRAQNNLGNAYGDRIAGERQENLERAIACYHEALRVRTLAAFPFEYANVQNNLGNAYGYRIAGERRENLERAIACYHEALRVWTFAAFPFDYARVQSNLGETYQDCSIDGQWENLERAISCYREALRVRTPTAFPHKARNIYLNIAEAEAQRKGWNAVQEAYTAALKAEDLLIILGAGTLGRDAILKEGGSASIRNGYALHRLGRISEAAAAMERGRARGLAEAIAFDAADPVLITNEGRRSRYTLARAALITSQAALHIPLSQDLDENTRRHLDLEHIALYRQAKAVFDALVTEIRAAHDPEDFLDTPFGATTILQVAVHIRLGHALVYLVATPWGGAAVAALSDNGSSTARFTSLDLPDLTETFINLLIETRLNDASERVIGGFMLAQTGEGFARLCQQWDGETFYEKANALHAACLHTQQASMLDHAFQEAMSYPPFASLAEQPLAQLDPEDQSLLMTTLDTFFLQHELKRCQEQLGTTILHPLVVWLQEQGVMSLTLIPCGNLAAFPLVAVLLPDGRSVGETLSTSVAPSAHSLLQRSCWRNQPIVNAGGEGASAAKRERRVCSRGLCSLQANRRTTLSATPIMRCCKWVLASPTYRHCRSSKARTP